MPEMTFVVHVGGKICWNPPKCWDWLVGLQYRLRVFGYKREKDIDLYFLIPGSTPPDGLGFMWHPESFDIMMQMHDNGTKDCHLYVVKKPRPGSYDCGAAYGDDDDADYDGYGQDEHGAPSYGDDADNDGYDDGGDDGSSGNETKNA
ncbi:hypothetical protein ACP4OV_029244 [Aristida adscensionis]